MSERQEKMEKELRRLASAAVNAIANKQSLITVTRTDIAPNFKNATIYVSVLPVEEEHTAILFLNRHKDDVRHHIKKNLKTRIIPFITFEADLGEKNRQRIDELSREL